MLAASPEEAVDRLQKEAMAHQNEGECDVVDDPHDFRAIAVWEGRSAIYDSSHFDNLEVADGTEA